VARKAEGQVATFREVVQELLREDGPAGFFRGVLPRMASSALWGTAMVTVGAQGLGVIVATANAACTVSCVPTAGSPIIGCTWEHFHKLVVWQSTGVWPCT
jgi:hypothetical protein